MNQQAESRENEVYKMRQANKKDINFYLQFKKNPNQEQMKKKILAIAVPGGVLVGVCVAVSLVFLISNLMLQNKLNGINAYLTDETNLQKYDEVKALDTENSVLEAYIASDTYAWKAIQSYPRANSIVVNEILACGQGKIGIQINSYDARTGMFQFTATAANAEECNAFIASLKNSEVFADVQYSGYGYEDSRQSYLINVSCFLSETAGRQEG